MNTQEALNGFKRELKKDIRAWIDSNMTPEMEQSILQEEYEFENDFKVYSEYEEVCEVTTYLMYLVQELSEEVIEKVREEIIHTKELEREERREDSRLRNATFRAMGH